MRREHLIAVFAVVALAALLRLPKLGYDSLGHDEAFRANWSHHGSLAEARRLPPLTLLLLRTVQRQVGRSEVVLRLPFALAGIACVLVLYGFARRHLDQGAAVLIACVAACHPVLVLYSRMVKVFSLEALGCAVVLWAGLEAYRKRTGRQLIAFTALALVAMGCTFTGSLVVAAWMPLLGWACLRRERGVPGPRWGFVGSACVLSVAAWGCYVWLAGMPLRESVITYFAAVEHVWPTAYTPSALGVWLVVSVQGAGQYVLGITHDWPPLSWCVATLELLAIAASIGVVWRRCRPLCVVVMILAVEVVLAGALCMWPLGKVRTMTYSVPIVAIGVGCGLWRLVRALGWSCATVGLLGVCIGLPAARAVESTIISPRVYEHMRPVMAHIRSNLQPGDAIFVYYGAASAFEYYADLDTYLWLADDESEKRFVRLRWQDVDVPVQVEPSSDRQHPAAFAERFDAWVARHPRVWFLMAHSWKHEQEEWVRYLEDTYSVLDMFQTADASAHLLARPDGPGSRTGDTAGPGGAAAGQ